MHCIRKCIFGGLLIHLVALLSGFVCFFFSSLTNHASLTSNPFPGEYYKCSGERLPFERTNDAANYLKKFPYILSLKNHRDDTIWYVRGKTFSSNVAANTIVRCKINRSPPKRSSMNRSTSARAINTIETNHKHRYQNGNPCGEMSITRLAGYGQSDQERRYASDFEILNSSHAEYGNNSRTLLNIRNFSKSFDNDAHSYRNSPKTTAAIHNYDLLGDDFFIELAKIDLSRPFTMRKHSFNLFSLFFVAIIVAYLFLLSLYILLIKRC